MFFIIKLPEETWKYLDHTAFTFVNIHLHEKVTLFDSVDGAHLCMHILHFKELYSSCRMNSSFFNRYIRCILSANYVYCMYI